MVSIVLRKDVPDLGKAGEVKTVAAGYARNYLLPQRLGVEATPSGIKWLEEEHRRRAREDAKTLEEATLLGKKLAGLSLTIRRSAGEQGKLFGSVTAADLADAMAQEGVSVDKRMVRLDEPLKALGVYTVTVQVHQDVESKIKVWVVKE